MFSSFVPYLTQFFENLGFFPFLLWADKIIFLAHRFTQMYIVFLDHHSAAQTSCLRFWKKKPKTVKYEQLANSSRNDICIKAFQLRRRQSLCPIRESHFVCVVKFSIYYAKFLEIAFYIAKGFTGVVFYVVYSV